MGENGITKPLGLVLIITAHMVFNEPSHAHVIGTLGRNITLRFIFNSSIKNNSHIGIYTTGEKKIADNLYEEKSFDLHPQNSSVCYHITNLILNHSNTYWASLFDKGGPKKSNEVQLIIKEKNSSTAPPTLTTNTGAPASESNSRAFVIILVVLPVVLLATVLPWLICSLVKPKELVSGDDVKPSLALNKQQQQRPAQSSTPTVQETVASSSSMPAPSVIYSVLDFPRRPLAVVEINPRDTEYAAVSYLPEKGYI